MHKFNNKTLKATAALTLAATMAIGSIPVTQVMAKSSDTKTAQEVVRDMTVGYNLGNSLDVQCRDIDFPMEWSAETWWGNPETTQELVDTIAKAGFNTIRVPVTWGQYMDPETGKIQDYWMKRVKEVVDYGMKDGMYVILNTHHDTEPEGTSNSFYYPSAKSNDKSEKYFRDVWTQVATTFKDYDYHLIFETMNEPRLCGTNDEWWFPRNNPSKAVIDGIEYINHYNQVALDAIRAVGGENATRCVMVPGYGAGIDGAMTQYFKLPKDTVKDRVIVSVHAYTPYYFALATDTFVSEFDKCNKSEIDDLFNDIDKKFTSNNIPVVIGEMGTNDRDNTEERIKWTHYYMGRAAKANDGLVACVLWDNGAHMYNNMSYINREKCEWWYPEYTIIEAMMDHVDGTPAKIGGGDIPQPSTQEPTEAPTQEPTEVPTQEPTVVPTQEPTQVPTQEPTQVPTEEPTQVPTEPTVVPTEVPTEVPSTDEAKDLTITTVVNNWGSGYQLQIKVANETKKTVNGWTLKINKKDIDIDDIWNVNFTEDKNYYVITPVDWNKTIEPGKSFEFGVQGSGHVADKVEVLLNGKAVDDPVKPTEPVEPSTEEPSIEVPSTEEPSVPVDPSAKVVVIKNAVFDKEVDLSTYDYKNVVKVEVKFKGTAKDFNGAVVIGDWAQQTSFDAKDCKNNSIIVNVTKPQNKINIRKWWANGTLEIENLILTFK